MRYCNPPPIHRIIKLRIYRPILLANNCLDFLPQFYQIRSSGYGALEMDINYYLIEYLLLRG